jgi:hypothetical protein
MSIDFPRAWEICKSVEPEYHHNDCSYNKQRLLCDCDVVYKHRETLDKNVFYGAGGRIISGRAAAKEPKV